MTDIAVLLLPEGDAGSSLRSKNLDGETFRQVLLNHGNHGESLIARAKIVEVVSGTLTPGGDRATLLVFEFRFLSLDNSRRFISARVTLKFGDVGSKAALDPEVYQIAPEDVTLLDKIITSKDIEQSLNGGINGGIPMAGGNLGVQWKVTQRKDREHSARLTGVKYNLRESLSGDDNAAIWSLEEHSMKRKGIPNFLRTAVILRRKTDKPFRVDLSVETNVDFRSKLGTVFGSARTEPIDPVNIDPALVKLHQLGLHEDEDENVDKADVDRADVNKGDIGKVDGDKLGEEKPTMKLLILENMSKLKLGHYAAVEFATIQQTTH